jgi:molecular chaperone DnaK
MKREADLHAEEDKKKRDLIEAKNLADSLVYTTEKTLGDAGDKISAETKKEIEEKVNELKKVKDGDNMDDIKQKTAELSQVIQKIGAEMYKQTGGQEKPQGGEEGNKGPEEGQYKEK